MQDAITYFASRIFVIKRSGEKSEPRRLFRRGVGRPLVAARTLEKITCSSEVAVNSRVTRVPSSLFVPFSLCGVA